MFRRFSALLLVVIVTGIPCAAQIHIPRLPDNGDIGVEVKIPGLNRILKAPPALSTSFEDAVTGVPFLDDFDPPRLTAMVEMPRVSASFVLWPGGYEATMES